MIPGKTYTYDDYLRILWRRKWVIVVPFLFMSVGTYLFVKRLPNLYRSQTTILVVPQRVPQEFVRSTVTAPIEDRLRSISEQILSRSRLERIINDFNLYAEELKSFPMEDVVATMGAAIKTETVRGDSFTVSYTSSDARIAKIVTERLASMFIDENLRDRLVLADGTSAFLETQLEDARQRLITHEKKLETYRQRYDGELPSQLETNLQVINHAETQLQVLVNSIGRDRDQKLLQERLLADLQAPDAVPPVPVSAAQAPQPPSAADRLEAARAALAELQVRLTPDHPDVGRAKRALRDLETQAAAEASRHKAAAPDAPVTSPPTAGEVAQRNRIRELQLAIQNQNQEIAGKQAEQRRLADVIANAQRRIAAVPTRESELAELMRDYETLQKTYTSLLSRKEDSKIAADLERRQVGEQFKILDPAREAEKPISPKRTQLNVIGALAGLILGFSLTALLEYLDSSLKTEDDVVQTLMLPVLALIPFMATDGEAYRKRKRRTFVLSCVAAAVVLVAAVAAWKLNAIGWVR